MTKAPPHKHLVTVTDPEYGEEYNDEYPCADPKCLQTEAIQVIRELYVEVGDPEFIERHHPLILPFRRRAAQFLLRVQKVESP